MAKFSDITFTMTDVIKLGVFVSVIGTMYYNIVKRIDEVNNKLTIYDVKIERLESGLMTQNNRTNELEKFRWQTEAILVEQPKTKKQHE